VNGGGGEPVGLNVYLGTNAGAAAKGGLNTHLGANSGVFSVGKCNVFVGESSGPSFAAITVGATLLDNVVIGVQAGASLGSGSATTSSSNVVIGAGAANAATTISNSVALGVNAQVGAATSNNISIGPNAGNVSSSGNANLVIGQAAGTALTTAANNIIIGTCAGTTAGGVSGSLTTQSNRIVMGNSGHTCAQIQTAWSVTSDVRDKALDPAGVPYGLLFVEQLEPIAYRFCNRETNEVTDDKLRYGFSAQDVRGLEGDVPVISSDDNPDKLNITDSYLLPVLVNAIKELSEKNRVLEERIAALEDK
jgi:hypothetical protein